MELNPYAPPTATLTHAPALAALAATPQYFPVSKTKLVLMSLGTLGLYEMYWFYKNWCFVRREQPDIRPFWRAFFGIFYCHSLLKDVEMAALAQGVPFQGSTVFLALVWILLSLAGRLPGLFSLLSLFSVAPLLLVQESINELNRRAAPDHDPNSRFSVVNILGMLVGFTLLIFSQIDPS